MRAGRITIHSETRGLVVSLQEAAYFVSGDDQVSPAGIPVLRKIAATLENIPNPIRLEGHTDSIPIHNSRFQSNWELSAARSIAMLEALSTQFSDRQQPYVRGGLWRLFSFGKQRHIGRACEESARGYRHPKRSRSGFITQFAQELVMATDLDPSAWYGYLECFLAFLASFRDSFSAFSLAFLSAFSLALPAFVFGAGG